MRTDEIEAKIGVTGLYSLITFMAGLTYPVPKFAKNLPKAIRLIWRVYFFIGQSLFIALILSNVMLLIVKGHTYIGIQTECVGSIALVIFVIVKTLLLYNTQDNFTKIVKNVHNVAQEFENNPIGLKDYITVHKKHIAGTINYCITKTIANYISVYFLIFEMGIYGMLTDDPNERMTPMLGWFPFEFDTRLKFMLAILFQAISYPTLVSRESAIDITYMAILSVISNQFLYLGQILSKIIKSNEKKSEKEQKEIIRWWLSQHQKLLKIVEDFQKITQYWLFVDYAYVSFIFFLVLLRLTVDKDFVIEQQLVIIGLTAGNLLHIFVISSLGDEITLNSTKIKTQLQCSELYNTKQKFAALMIATRCNRPVELKFADNRVLAVKSFGDIMKSLLGYFATIYQLRN